MTEEKKTDHASTEKTTPSDQSASPSHTSPKTDALSKEEQMARFEEALKDEDWGHQPC